MSIHAIKAYRQEIEKLIHFGGTKKETAIRNAFYYLLNEYAKQKSFMLCPEITVKGKLGKNVTPDGTLKDNYRQDWGYWESKDEADDIDEEIRKKFSKGYPDDNILFEDSNTAVLIQNGSETMRVSMADAEKLDKLIISFISFERPEVHDFRVAIEHFKADIPRVTDVLRDIIGLQETDNKPFVTVRDAFLELCKASINPDITKEDVREMMIQHILTEDIFNVIFDETHFHRENNIARELEKVINTFFTGTVRRTALGTIQHYYQTINASAANIADHHEKQKFLKVVYETFYKSYNPKAADRLGVVYTPNEIVKFMIESTDYLLHKHFGRFLEDKNVEILDPAAGTGTYICDIIDYLRKDKVEYKYKNEIHANEVAILPYYIANLNIEFTYKQQTGNYAEFKNLCFVDTLDNMGFEYKEKEQGLFSVSAENTERIKRQNNRKISVIIGNPPYNAKQGNYNYQNSNKAYKIIDNKIKQTYIELGTAQNQNQVYDMYLKFFRWASERINEDGIISFITNRGFIDFKAFDGVRKTFFKEFDYLYFVDLGGDITNKIDKTLPTGNIFGIKTGVAISFLIKDKNNKNNHNIFYYSIPDKFTKDEKLQIVAELKPSAIQFERIRPDEFGNWLNIISNDFENHIPIISKTDKNKLNVKAIFGNFSRGVESNKEEWVYDFSLEMLIKKINYFINIFNKQKNNLEILDNSIKWSRELVRHLHKNVKIEYNKNYIVNSLFKPFTNKNLYLDKYINSYIYEWLKFEKDSSNISINFISGISKPFSLLASNLVPDLNSLSAAAGGVQCIPFHRYDTEDNKIDNITDWALKQFKDHYNNNKITKEDIFNYVYGVLHNPAYRKKYELNLKREFPRIPFYDEFKKWCNWGKALMVLHINYETVQPFKLKITTMDSRIRLKAGGNGKTGKPKKELFDENKHEPRVKAKLKALKETGTIELDELTTMTGIPPEAWEYKLGNRSAIEWILDQYKEKKPTDPTIAEKFNTYRFADYKDKVIDLIQRVTTVSVETMKIVRDME